jgi:hypothetical protein
LEGLAFELGDFEHSRILQLLVVLLVGPGGVEVGRIALEESFGGCERLRGVVLADHELHGSLADAGVDESANALISRSYDWYEELTASLPR